jgi:hypothetical protein
MKTTKTLIAILTITTVVFLRVNAQTILDNGLVAYYPFDGNVNDASGNHNDGVVYGATLTTNIFGDAGSAYAFNGDQEYILAADSPSLEVTNRLTMCAWINFGAGGTDNPRIISKTLVNGFELFTWGTSNQRQIGFLTYADATILTSAQYINAGDWAYITATFDGTNKNLYVNGVLDASVAASCIFTNSGPLTIGQNANNGQDNYVGLINGVRLYNRALSSSEVSQLYAVESTESSFLNISIHLTLYKQSAKNDNGITTVTAAPKQLQYATKDILKILASDKHAQGYWPSNSFPKDAQLATDGKHFAVLKGTNVLVNVSDIMSIKFGDNDISSGTLSDVTGLATKPEHNFQILNISFDDSEVANGSNLKFYFQGLSTQTISDTSPIGGDYKETINGSMTDAVGEGTSANDNFFCKGSVTVSGKLKLSLH